MKSHAQFVTTPTADTPGTCLILHFDTKRYLIGNLHEGFQRAAAQRQTKLLKVSDIFLTGKTEWKNIGGLTGTILTLADSVASAASQAPEGKEKVKSSLTLHGGHNILYTLATGRRYIFRQGLPINVNEYDNITTDKSTAWKPTWSDENIRVWAMPVLPDTYPHSFDEQVPQSSPRKRNFRAYSECTNVAESDLEATIGIGPRDQQTKLLRGVVSDMFDSDFRLDALIETPLSEVKLPAAIFIRDPTTKHIKAYEGPRPGSDKPLPNITVLVRKPWPGALIRSLPSTKPSALSMSYIIRNHPQRGKFLPQKAKELKVKPGPDFGKLAAGQSVVSMEGHTIQPDQVLGPGKPGGGLIIAEVPGVEYVKNLIERPEWHANEVMEGVEAVIWILGPGVAEDARLHDFINEYKGTSHIISSIDHAANYLAFDSSASATIKHCQIDPSRFDVLVHENRAPALPERLSACTVAERGLTIHLEPSVKIEVDTVAPPLNTAAVVKETSPEVLDKARAAQREVEAEDFQQLVKSQGLPSPEAEIIALGTGSALPSKYRNVSATLLRVPGVGSYLLDCGENTLGQLTRMYGSEKLREVLQDLKMIWISHMHADHQLGTTSVIKAWYNEVYGQVPEPSVPIAPKLETKTTDLVDMITEPRRLVVVSESTMIEWLKEYSEVEDFGYAKILPLHVQSARPGSPESTIMRWHDVPVHFHDAKPEVVDAMKRMTGLVDLQSAWVPHTQGSRGVALSFPDGFKLTFSGDCRPSKNLVEIGMNSTVLIHEATFDDDLQGDAIAKKHSTTSEAIGVGFAMRARRILLTHFSQRYQKISSMEGMDGRNVKLEDFSAHDAETLAMTGGNSDAQPPIDNLPVASSQAEPSLQQEAGNDRATVKPQVETKVAVAFDFMRVKVKDLGSLEKFAPALELLYA